MIARLRCWLIGCLAGRLQIGQNKMICRDCGKEWQVRKPAPLERRWLIRR